MRVKLLLFIAASIFYSCGGVKKYNEQITKLHAPEKLRQDVDEAYNQLKKYHPKLYQYTSKEKMDFKFDSLKTTIKIPISSREFYERLAPVVGSIKQGHLGISPPDVKFSKKEMKRFRDKTFPFYSMDFEYLEEKLWVIGALEKDTVLIGSEVIAIENRSPKELIKKYNTLIASDGYNQTLFQGMVGSRFSNFYIKNNGFQDSIHLTLKNSDSVFKRTIRWKDKKENLATLTDSLVLDSLQKKPLKKLSKEERKAEKSARKKLVAYNRKRGYIKSKDQYTRTFNQMGPDSLIGYMKIRGFTNGRPEEFYEETFNIIDSLGISNLIIDLRNNGGGSLAEIDKLYSYLTDSPYTLVKPSEVNTRIPFLPYFTNNTNSGFIRGLAVLFSPIIITHNLLKTEKIDGSIYYRFSSSKERKPDAKNYKGKLYVIINGNSFSASSILSTQLKGTHRATFVGQETGGAYNGTVAGIFKGYELPNSKVVMRIGMMQVETFYKVEPDGFGVPVDKEIIPTRADREAEIDPELEWILDDIISSTIK